MIEYYNLDCMEGMKRYGDKHFSLAICDPPYGIGAENHQRKLENGWKQWNVKSWDTSIPEKQYWDELFRISKNQIVWGGNYMTEFLPPRMGWIMWDKGQRDFSLADGELAWTSYNKALRIFEMSRGEMLAKNNKEGGRIHPTQKPVQLYKWLLHNYAKKGDLILDTHVGSASSLIACYDMKFDAVGFELDKDYYEASKKRLEEFMAQGRLFDD